MKPSTIQLLKDKPEECKEIFMSGSWSYYNADSECWNKFLKKHTAPDWEILSFKHKDSNEIAKKYENGNYGFHDVNEGLFTLDSMLNANMSVRDGSLIIHSVRRSDGEVFKEDHWVSWLSGAHKGKITAFELDNDNTMNAIVEGKLFPLKIALFNLTKLKPLFKTDDGKDYYKGDPLFEVYGKDKTDIAEIAKFRNLDVFRMDLEAGHRLAFSTREAAEQWVNDHKPSVSIAQLKQAGLSEDIINSLRPF